MDTQIIKRTEEGDFNRWGQKVIACRFNCGRVTTMLGTRECDRCHTVRCMADASTRAAFEEGLGEYS